LFFTSFLILGHSSLDLSDEDIEELRRRNGENDESETARERDFSGGNRDDTWVCFGGAGVEGSGMLISVYSGFCPSSAMGVASGTTKGEGDGSGAASGVVTA
jgi:hypothetical protein